MTRKYVKLTPEEFSDFAIVSRFNPIVQSAIPYKKEAVADKVRSWDGSAEMTKATTPEEWKRMSAWVDESAPENKGSYKLPHHTSDGMLVPEALYAAAAAIQGARGGVDIPSSDLPGVKSHLAKHYVDLGEVAPWERKNQSLLDFSKRGRVKRGPPKDKRLAENKQ
jgi:hypothetical protein